MSLYALTHGWAGLGMGFATVQGPMLAAMIRARAGLDRLLLAPLVAVPVTVAAGVGIALISPALHGLGAAPSGLAELAFGGALSAGLGYAAGRGFAAAPKQFRHQRGAVVEADLASDRRHSTPIAGTAGIARELELSLANQPIPRSDESKHFKLIGTTGTGKSTAIAQLLGTALARGDRAVIADPDGGYLRRFYDAGRGDVILNPFDQRSVKWDLFGEIQQPYDVEQLARALLPDNEPGDRSWRGYARTFLTAVTRQAHSAGIREVGELYRLLVIAPTAELRTLTGGTPAQPFLEEHNSRMFDSIRSVTSSAVASLEHIAQQSGPSFSVRNWIRRGDQESRGVLFIPYRASQIAALRSTVSAWMRIAIFEAMAGPECDQRLWFVIDELDALGHIDGLKDALARVRKFGGRCIIGFQSVAQVAGTYGAGDAHTIVENCGNTLILRCSASEGGGTSRFASTLIGQREVLRTMESRSRRPGEFIGAVTRSENLSIEPAVMDSEIEQLPDLAGYLKLASGARWLRVRLPPPQSALSANSTPAFIAAAPAARADMSTPSDAGVTVARSPRKTTQSPKTRPAGNRRAIPGTKRTPRGPGATVQQAAAAPFVNHDAAETEL
ncbi:MAG TPA: type IV secretion system DNA-binding domain-containing protein [Steroidobacteraceae bacterium]